MRILYLGIPVGAVSLLADGHAFSAIGLAPLDLPGARRVRRNARGTLILGRPDLNDPEVVRVLASSRPDLLVSYFWPKRIPRAVLDLAPGYNVHPSLLPRLRGPDPFYWAIRDGHRSAGVTFHRLTEDYDRGPIVAQEEIALDGNETGWGLARKLDRPALRLLRESVAKLGRGEALPERPQDERLATAAPQPSELHLEISFHASPADIVRCVRAASPVPGATLELEDGVVDVIEARAYRGSIPRVLEIGQAFRAPEGLVVVCKGGAVLLAKVRTEDDRVLSGEDVFSLL